MARLRENANDRKKITYSRTTTIDDQNATNEPKISLFRSPLKRVQHPADRSSVVIYLQRLTHFCLMMIISFPSILFLSLILPILWLIRTLIRLTCRYHCTITPCSCSYLSGSDLFWLYNSKKVGRGRKEDEREDLDTSFSNSTTATIFSLDGKTLSIFFCFIQNLNLFRND